MQYVAHSKSRVFENNNPGSLLHILNRIMIFTLSPSVSYEPLKIECVYLKVSTFDNSRVTKYCDSVWLMHVSAL